MNTDTVTLPTSTFTLEEVAEHFEDWRRWKRKGSESPSNCGHMRSRWWSTTGCRPSRRLRLSGRDLNWRRRAIGSERARSAVSVTFVELAPAVVAQTPSPQCPSAPLELIRPDGLRLRIAPGTGIDARSLLERFMVAG